MTTVHIDPVLPAPTQGVGNDHGAANGNGVSKRIYLSPPHMGGLEQTLVQETFVSNWIAPLGPLLDPKPCDGLATMGEMM